MDGSNAIVRDLFPITRSITGDGLRERFPDHPPVPLEITRFRPEHPRWIGNSPGMEHSRRPDRDPGRPVIVDFARSNLHVVGYSIPSTEISRDELAPTSTPCPTSPT